MRADGRTLILGGTKGLGLALADACAARGYKTIELGSSVEEPMLHGSRMRLQLDLRDPDSTDGVIATLDDMKVDHFIWAAGRHGRPFTLATSADDADTMWVNFTGALPLVSWWCQQVPHFPPDEHYSLVVVSSTSADKPRSGEEVYAASKAAQAHFTRSLAQAAPGHLCVALFKPGGMKTPFWQDHEPDGYDSFLDPAKVAMRILDDVDKQIASDERFCEISIPRDSL